MKRRLLFLGLLSIIFLSGCAEKTPYPTDVDSTLKYSDKECREDRFGMCRADIDIKVDRLVVDKSKRILYAYRKGKVVETFKIALGKNSIKGSKEKAGDLKTPEGSYKISYKQYSRNYYKSLKISYPNKKDIALARAKGVNPGGFIMIHGQPRWNAVGKADNYMLENDWTEGCIALSNKDIDRLFYAVESGIPIKIKS